ncbi:MAG: sigma-70 family RNA polymerase sigma factor [Myxococcota bacterium]
MTASGARPQVEDERAPALVVRLRPEGSVARLDADGVETAVLVERARRGERQAESLLYRRYAPGLLEVATHLLRSVPAAEDVLHDAFLLAYSRLGQLRAASQFRGWLLAIIVSLVKKRLRRQRLLRWVGLEAVADAPLDVQARDGASVEARGELAVLDAALKALPVAQRMAWMLRYVEGEKLDDVALAMGKSLATTKRYLAKAEAHLARHVSLEEP